MQQETRQLNVQKAHLLLTRRLPQPKRILRFRQRRRRARQLQLPPDDNVGEVLMDFGAASISVIFSSASELSDMKTSRVEIRTE